MYLIGKKVAVVKNHNNGGHEKNNKKYIGRAYNKVVEIVYKTDNDFYITDFFIPKFKNKNNDYIHYGFLKLRDVDFKVLE